MKKLLIFAFAVFAFAACTQNDVEELSANRADVPETLTVGFEGGDDTRIQLEAGKTVWTSGDLVSVFYKSDANQQWEYRGETGARVADLYCVDKGVESSRMNYVVVAYPYNPDYIISTASGNIETTLPAVQHYAEESYGVGDNLMVSQSEFTQFSLKNVCGWLKIQLTGNGERVTRLTLRGNNEEQLAGLIYVDTATAESTLASKMGSSDDNNAGGNLVFDDTIVTELTLDCGKGVELGEEAKSFYIAVPPQTFEKGFTVEVKCDNGTSTTKSTSEPITIERNHIQPMEAIEYDGVLPKVYELAYRTNDGNPLDPRYTEGFGGEFEENIFDAATGEGKLVFVDAITTIPDNAFVRCENLTWIDIPKGITTIGASAFSSCSSMEELTIPDSVTTIGANAFWGCSSLTSVTIPDSVTTIGISAFRECYSLTSVTIGDSVTTIGEDAFHGCISLTSVTIGDSVTTIGRFAFSSCGLTSVTIPDSVTKIGGSAFRYCNRLTSVTIGDSVTTIGDYAFEQCDSLTSVYCEATTPPSLDGNSVFNSNASGRKIYVPAESLEAYKAANNWRYDASSIVGYDFSITSIINYTTYDGQIVNARLPIISNTYSNGIGTIEFLGSIIPERAFCDCDSLTSITIPDSVTTIGVFAFADCDSLTEFNGKFAFEDGRCWIVDGTLNSFAPAGLTSYTIPDSVTTIGEGAFAYYSCLTSITIPDSVTTIGKYAFEYCKSLTSVTIGDSVTTIGERAFYDCDSLTSVTIPDSVTTIGVYAFYDCDSLTSVIIGDSVTTIGERAFYDCDSLTSVIIGDSVTTIGNYAFYDCDSLTSITIPDSVTTIGWHAFGKCDSLTSVTIGDSVTTIGNYAFYHCYSLTNVYCEATTPPSLGGNGFDVNASGRKIYVPAASVEAYKSATYWSEYKSAIVGYDF